MRPLNEYIEHTLLKPEATDSEFESFIEEALSYKFPVVCVSPYIAGPIREALTGEDVKVATVVGFPHGNLPTSLKLDQVRYFADRGIDEIDFVMHYAEWKNAKHDNLLSEIFKIGELCKEKGIVSKCIVETYYLTRAEKLFIFRLLEESPVDYIKTSTGYAPEGAQVEDVSFWSRLRESSAEDRVKFLNKTTVPLKIKAAGGVRTLEDALNLIAAGADRLGMSSSVAVMEAYNNSTLSEQAEEETLSRELITSRS
jgi:deoxyribose-phosphate aldolase